MGILANQKKVEELGSGAHKPSSGDFFPILDGIRGIAVLSVVAFHTLYFNPAYPFQNALNSIIKTGWIGVPIFFVLSGFLISHTIFKAANRFDAFSYAARRAAKIIPPFYLSIIVFCILCYFWKGWDNLF